MIPRQLEPMILESLEDFPAVLVTGARQVGKSTLVQSICQRKWKAPYLTLDDRNTLDLALTDPDGLVAAHPDRVAIDEVQRAPDLLRAIKLAVDRRRKPGRFLLTGSANLLTLKRVSETLAGRMALHELYPFSLSEKLRRPRPPSSLKETFQSKSVEAIVRRTQKIRAPTPEELLSGILRGGYPDPALTPKFSVRLRWFEAYRKTYIERDTQDVQAIERLADFSRLLGLVASRTGQVINFADLGRDAGLPYATVRRYMSLLEQTYQIRLVPPYFSNVSKRYAKAPKLYWTDTGLACHLLGIHDLKTLKGHPRLGALAETWVAQELIKLIGLSQEPMRLYGWRLPTGQEIDFLIERGGHFLGIESRWGQRIDPSGGQRFRMLKNLLGAQLIGTVVLYGGSEALMLRPQYAAIPYQPFFS